jgi:hypothetical protein
LFILLWWLATRAVIFVAMFWFGPAHPGWNVLTNWDGEWYERVATIGYEYAPDGKQHDVAFFPLYPLTVALLQRLVRIPFGVAASLVNNVAFLLALIVIFDWVRGRRDAATARWTIATLCLLPVSLFTAVAYSEGLYLFLSAGAVRAFERRSYFWAGIAAALASATRSFGVLFFPAFAFEALRKRRSGAAYLCAFSALLGPLCFAAYCSIAFRDPLAFVHVQSAWRAGLGFSFADWEYIFAYGITWKWPYQLAVVLIAWVAYRRRRTLGPRAASVVAFALATAEMIIWGKEQLTFLLIGVGCVLVIRYREHLGTAASAYALLGILLILFSGKPYSVDRFAYSLVPISFALAILWRRFPALGFATLAVSAFNLPQYAIRFANGIFVD